MDLNSPDASRAELDRISASLESEAGNGEVEPEPQPEPETETQEEPETTPEPEPKVEPEEDHGEKSRLGRKVKRIEDEVLPKLTSMEETIKRLDQFANAIMMQAQAQQQSTTDEDEYIPTTKAELLAWMKQEQRKEHAKAAENQAVYVKGYLETLKELSEDEEPDIRDEIIKLTTEVGEPYNKKRSENAVADAAYNYSKAMKHVLRERASKPATPKNPLRGGDPKGPLGTASTGGGTAASPVKLDSYARSFFANRVNPKTQKAYTDEEMRRMMK